MRLYEFAQPQRPDLNTIIREVLPIIKHELQLTKLPKIRLVNQINDGDQPTFGRYQDDSNTLEVVKQNRHPVDILRTLAHELVHYKQDTQNRIKPHSGDTGSDIEDEAHALAGVIMRHINKKYPHYLKLDNVEEALDLPKAYTDYNDPIAKSSERNEIEFAIEKLTSAYARAERQKDELNRSIKHDQYYKKLVQPSDIEKLNNITNKLRELDNMRHQLNNKLRMLLTK